MTVADQQFTEIVTTDNDRWDLIAWRAYGDPYAFEAIVAANRHVPILPVLEAGLRIYIPVRPRTTVTTGLPPWKRARS